MKTTQTFQAFGRPRKWSGVWDHSLDEATKPPRVSLEFEIISCLGRFAFACFITAGFAAGQRLIKGSIPCPFDSIRACECLFFWSLVLICCYSSRGD